MYCTCCTRAGSVVCWWKAVDTGARENAGAHTETYAGAGADGAVAGSGAGVLAGAGAGVLEIKCPFNRGNPLAAMPPREPAWYYMPQVGGPVRHAAP